MNADQSSNVLSDVEITGTITFTGGLSFDGKLQNGDMDGEDLVLGPKAQIKGNINASSLVLHGAVTGDVLVAGRCELKGSASLVGSLITNRLAMDEGATLIGNVEITPQPKSISAPSKTALPSK
jgi:cytoskeletal protein CcmA (bactofilin family)